ncbi:hypothetical protein PVAG01_09466 [Phlyctema vagabunda]|uniref:HCP-like protein n=1 Tax=Phlyctema vagabunda TaxID=108571 RepID=A0ABR4P7F8_9HELO
MSSLKRSIGFIHKTNISLSVRSLHTTLAARAPPIVPKRVHSPPRRMGVPRLPVQKIATAEECLPPNNLLHSARKSGALNVEPVQAVEILQEYQRQVSNPSPGWEKRICSDFSIQPETLTMLGRILNRCSSNGQRVLGKRLVLSASQLGDFQATYDLVESGLRTKSLEMQKSLVGPLSRLGLQAKKEDNPAAMVLLGKVLLSQNRPTEALEWFTKASKHPDQTFYGASEALIQRGRMLLASKDRDGAEQAFRKAAMDLDDPTGYFYLSQFQEAGSPEQEVYLLKAASSGIVEAMHNLGNIELAKINANPDASKKKNIEDYGLAREWFQAAAMEGFGLSMLNMASICKSVGQDDVAIQWVERAEALPEVDELAKDLRKKWTILDVGLAQ